MTLPASYGATLAHVRTVFPGAMIAGGCLRDWDNARPVKDVDVFAPYISTNDGFEGVELRVRSLLLPGEDIVGKMGGYESWATAECIGVFDIASHLLDYQLICLSSDQASILPRIDMGICRIGYDGEFVIRTNEYLEDQAARKFTLHRCDSGTEFDRSISRYERLSGAKYQGWTFEVSPLLQAEGYYSPYGPSDFLTDAFGA